MLSQRQHAFYPHSLTVVELHAHAVIRLGQLVVTNWRHQKPVSFCGHVIYISRLTLEYWRTCVKRRNQAYHYTGPLLRLCLLIRPPLSVPLTLIVCSVVCSFCWWVFVSGVIVEDSAASMPGLSLGEKLAHVLSWINSESPLWKVWARNSSTVHEL